LATTPIILATGSISGAGAPGVDKIDLAEGELLSLADTEPSNSGESYQWYVDEAPFDVAIVLNNAGTATPNFSVPTDAFDEGGTVLLRCVVNGLFSVTLRVSLRLPNTDSVIPHFGEKDESNNGGNTKGWHKAQTKWMREANKRLLYIALADPTSAGGLEAPIGSLARRDNAGTAELWQKTGVTNTDWILVGGSTPHQIGGAQHLPDTLLNLNLRISDATLIDTGDSRLSDDRDPNAHSLAGADHNPSTLAQLNAKVSDATLIDTGDSRLSDDRDPNAHGLAGADHNSATLAQLNAKVSDATLDDFASPRDANKIITTTGPTTMSVGAVADGQVLQRSGSTIIGASAGGPGSDTSAIHGNLASEISAIAAKATPVLADHLLIEDSENGNIKKRIALSNLPVNPIIMQTFGNYPGGVVDATYEVAAIAFGHTSNNGGDQAEVSVRGDRGGLAFGWVESQVGASCRISVEGEVGFAFGKIRAGFGGGGDGTIEAQGYASHAFGYCETGYDILGAARILTSGDGAWAGGHAAMWAGTGDAYIRASGDGSHAGGKAVSGNNLVSKILAQGQGTFANGFAYDGHIIASSNGGTAFGVASYGAIITGQRGFAFGYAEDAGTLIRATGVGSSVFGRANNAGSIIEATNDGSHAHGYSLNGGAIRSSGWGSTAQGHAQGALSEVKAAAGGAFASGIALNGNDVWANSDGSFAGGYARNFGITANAVAAFAFGLADTALISCTGVGAQQFGEGANALTNTFQIGNGGLRFSHKAIAPTGGTIQDGDVWVDSDGEVNIRSDGISRGLSTIILSRRRTLISTGTASQFNPFGTNIGGVVLSDLALGNFTLNAATGQITINIAGTYKLDIVLFLIHSASAILDLFVIWKNGTPFWSASTLVHSSVDPVERTMSTIHTFAAADTIECVVKANGASLLQATIGSTLNLLKVA
jgi:hypothetical protein